MGLTAAVHTEITQEVEALLGSGIADALDFEAVEAAVRRQALRLAARLVEQRLNADTADYTGPTRPCAYGRAARFVRAAAGSAS